MSNLFVVSDIHGHFEQFEKILTYWNEEDTLAILGDLIDRGPHSLQVVEKVIELQQIFGDKCIFLKGNHEEMLLNFLNNPVEKQEHYYINGGKETIDCFLAQLPKEVALKSVTEQAHEINNHFQQQLQFLQSAPLYKTIGDVLLTHAGFNSDYPTLDETTARDYIWIRKHYLQENQTPYVNVFGHTPVSYIHESNDVWLSEDKRYIAIDGGCYMSGQLNAVLLSQSGQLLEHYKVILEK